MCLPIKKIYFISIFFKQNVLTPKNDEKLKGFFVLIKAGEMTDFDKKVQENVSKIPDGLI